MRGVCYVDHLINERGPGTARSCTRSALRGVVERSTSVESCVVGVGSRPTHERANIFGKWCLEVLCSIHGTALRDSKSMNSHTATLLDDSKDSRAENV